MRPKGEKEREREGRKERQQKQQQWQHQRQQEHFRDNRVAVEIVFQLVHPATDASPRNELAIAVREEPDQRDVAKGLRKVRLHIS